MATIDTGLTTYTATKTDVKDDKTGALFITSMGSLVPGGPFGIHVWRKPAKGPNQEILFYPGDHGGLAVLWGKLYFVHNDAESKKILLEEIPGYVPKDAEISGTVVNINESQLALINKQISTIGQRAESAYAQSASAAAKTAELERRVKALENKPPQPSEGGLSKPQIEEIVWAKIWDIIYLIRLGMNNGSSTDQNIAAWITDLRSFIVKTVKG